MKFLIVLTLAVEVVAYLEVIAGDHIMYKDEGTEQIREDFFVHPDYEKPQPYSNNIARIELPVPFKINEYVQIAQLPPRNFQPTGDVLVAGWCLLEKNDWSDELHKVTISLGSNDTCIDDLVDDSMIGAGIDSSCTGDFGGPTFCDSPNGRVLCGIYSWTGALNCGVTPDVYTRTSHFLDWIKEIT